MRVGGAVCPWSISTAPGSPWPCPGPGQGEGEAHSKGLSHQALCPLAACCDSSRAAKDLLLLNNPGWSPGPCVCAQVQTVSIVPNSSPASLGGWGEEPSGPEGAMEASPPPLWKEEAFLIAGQSLLLQTFREGHADMPPLRSRGPGVSGVLYLVSDPPPVLSESQDG